MSVIIYLDVEAVVVMEVRSLMSCILICRDFCKRKKIKPRPFHRYVYQCIYIVETIFEFTTTLTKYYYRY